MSATKTQTTNIQIITNSSNRLEKNINKTIDR